MTKRVPLRGLRVAVEEAGTGEPVVLVHGFPLTRALYGPLAARLAARSKVVTYDLRHHGETGGDDEPTKMEDFAADLIGLLDALGIRRAVVGGLSMGGYLLLHAFERAPDRFRGLMLFDTRATPDDENARKGRHETAARVRREGPQAWREEFLRKLVSPVTLQKRPDIVEAVRAMTAQATAAGIARTLEALADRPSYMGVLPRVEVPTLVVVGQDDGITPPAMARVLTEGIGRATEVIVPEAGHVSPIEQPDFVGAAVEAFLEENDLFA